MFETRPPGPDAPAGGASRPGPERRGYPRMACCWPVTLETPGGGRLRASTGNLAPRGLLLYVAPEAAPPPGSPVRVVVHVPAAFQDRGAYFQFLAEGKGRVARLEDAGTPGVRTCGVAVRLDAPMRLRETFVGPV